MAAAGKSYRGYSDEYTKNTYDHLFEILNTWDTHL